METSDTDSRPLLRVGFVTAGLYFDPYQPQNLARFKALSAGSSGMIFGVIYDPSAQNYRIGEYSVRALSLPPSFGGYGLVRSFVRAFGYMAFVLGFALRTRLSGKKPLDLLVSSDPFKSGALAMVAGKILGIPYAVELNGNYEAAMELKDGATASWYMGLKAKAAWWLMPRVLRGAGAIKLLYEDQFGTFKTPELVRKTCVFHNLVPLASFKHEDSTERYLLLLGHPWLLKGVDLAIRAFLEVSDKHPEFHLRIVGYCPNPDEFVKLARGHPRIHLVPGGVPHPDAIRLINGCFALLLPSRTEGMGRVLLEAMAASKPLVGSRVDGIPRVIRHEQNGLLCESNNAEDLARQIDRLMAEPSFARKLGENAFADVHTRLSPAAYTSAYLDFLRRATLRPAHS